MTILNSDQALPNYPVASPVSGGAVCCSIGTLTISEAPEVDDTWRIVRLPANVTVVGGTVFCDGFDGLDMTLGWEATDDDEASPDGLGAFGALDPALTGGIKTTNGYQLPLGNGGSFKTFTRATTLVLTILAPPAAFEEGKIAVRVDYRGKDW
jgi:hypothetical protein